MANFTPKEIDLTSINKGERFDNGNIVPVESINAPIEASAYAQELSKMAMASAEQSKNRVDILETQIIQKQGTAIYVNGIAQSRVNVTSDPQIQLDELKEQNASQSSQIENLGQTDQNMQSQIDVLKKLYGVGSIYMSIDSTSPASLFGGTWEKIEGKFLLGASASYAVGSSGGEENHTLTINEMPSHKHDNLVSHQGGSSVYGLQILANGADANYNMHYMANAGEGQSHNNMPPYLAVNIWRRTA